MQNTSEGVKMIDNILCNICQYFTSNHFLNYSVNLLIAGIEQSINRINYSSVSSINS